MQKNSWNYVYIQAITVQNSFHFDDIFRESRESSKSASTKFIDFFNAFSDIDQLTRILVLCGTPSEETLNKITSEEARNYIRSLSHMERKNFSEVFKGANPLGKIYFKYT